jgi:hypothetical protein
MTLLSAVESECLKLYRCLGYRNGRKTTARRVVEKTVSNKKIGLPIAMGISGGLLLTAMAMRFGASPRTASMMGGALAAAVAAVMVVKRTRK